LNIILFLAQFGFTAAILMQNDAIHLSQQWVAINTTAIFAKNP
jgi:hypothetical protein